MALDKITAEDLSAETVSVSINYIFNEKSVHDIQSDARNSSTSAHFKAPDQAQFSGFSPPAQRGDKIVNDGVLESVGKSGIVDNNDNVTEAWNGYIRSNVINRLGMLNRTQLESAVLDQIVDQMNLRADVTTLENKLTSTYHQRDRLILQSLALERHVSELSKAVEKSQEKNDSGVINCGAGTAASVKTTNPAEQNFRFRRSISMQVSMGVLQSKSSEIISSKGTSSNDDLQTATNPLAVVSEDPEIMVIGSVSRSDRSLQYDSPDIGGSREQPQKTEMEKIVSSSQMEANDVMPGSSVFESANARIRTAVMRRVYSNLYRRLGVDPGSPGRFVVESREHSPTAPDSRVNNGAEVSVAVVQLGPGQIQPKPPCALNDTGIQSSSNTASTAVTSSLNSNQHQLGQISPLVNYNTYDSPAIPLNSSCTSWNCNYFPSSPISGDNGVFHPQASQPQENLNLIDPPVLSPSSLKLSLYTALDLANSKATLTWANPNNMSWSWGLQNNPEYGEAEFYTISLFSQSLQMEPIDNSRTGKWDLVGELRAIPLPMTCSISQLREHYRYHFIVHGIDKFQRVVSSSNAAAVTTTVNGNNDFRVL